MSPEPLPEPFIGAWIRRSIALDGNPPAEAQRVLWLQAASAFGDVRVPIDPQDPAPTSAPVSFAGVTTWDGTSLCWHRDLDLHGVTEADEGVITWDGADMIETGTFPFGGVIRAYREVWHRLDGAASPRLALQATDGSARLVQVGPHSVTVLDRRAQGGDYQACYRVWDGGRWRLEIGLGDQADELPAPPPLDTVGLAHGAVLDHDAIAWRVVELVS